MTKKCSACLEFLPISTFHKNASSKDGLQYYCKPCDRLKLKAYRQSLSAEERSSRNKSSNLRTAYGMSVSERDGMVAAQQGLCAICSTDLAQTAKGPCVDHNHDTGKVRGILCSPCNAALGLMGDNPLILQAAIGYLHDRGNYARETPEGNAQAAA
jgi:hypothetical protein